jgi:hypothetical protein
MTRARRGARVAVAVWLVVAGFAANPALALSPEAVAGAVAQRFGVTVLRVLPIERDGKPLYSVVVMNPGGNFNEAFKATILVVDPDTGELVPQFRQENSGYDLPAAPDRQPPADDGGTVIRRETFRGR